MPAVLLKHPVASRYIGTTRRWRKCHRGHGFSWRPFGRGSRHSLLGSAQRLQGVGPFRDQEEHLPLIHQRWWGLVGRSARHLVAAACARESLALRSGGGQLPAGFRWFQCLGPAPCSRGTGVAEDSAAAGEELDQQAGGLRHSRGQRKWRGFAIGASQRWRSETPVPRGSSALAAVCAGLYRLAPPPAAPASAPAPCPPLHGLAQESRRQDLHESRPWSPVGSWWPNAARSQPGSGKKVATRRIWILKRRRGASHTDSP